MHKSIEEQLHFLATKNFNLPLNKKPILQLHPNAKILVIGPAPGIRAHVSGTPWNDPSGDRLRLWMGISKKEFYDKNKLALISMNFWYPGVDKYGNDNPPNLTDAELWHRPLLNLLPNVKLTLLMGHKAQVYYLKDKAKASLTETVKNWQEYLPENIVCPHPSWHNNTWLRKNLWFESEVIPVLQQNVRNIIDSDKMGI